MREPFRTIDGRPLRWASPDGTVHAVEGCHISRPGDGILLWPVCGQGDVPANAGWKGEDEVTCPKCRAALNEGGGR